MTKYRVLPYKMGSRSARLLGRTLGGFCVYPRRRYRPRGDHVIINWGFSGEASWFNRMRETGAVLLNPPSAVAAASDKLRAFRAFDEAEVRAVPFTTDPTLARQWLADGKSVVCRTLTRASGGRGIIITDPGDDLPAAPLYTKLLKKRAEYRVHCTRGEVFSSAMKRRTYRVADEDVNWRIRNHDNGWIFARQGIALPPHVGEVAQQAVAALGLDFGAVDVLEKRDGAYVLEVNTACGLEGTTLDDYVNFIHRV